MSDMIKPKDRAQMDSKWQEGINLHKFIDQFADDHPLNKKAISLFRKEQGKYAPVTLDIYQDYLLFSHWQKFTQESYVDFSQRIYAMIRSEPVQEFHPLTRLQAMADGSWLESYVSKKALQEVFMRMDARARFNDSFTQAIDDLEPYESELTDLFLEFFPEINKAVEEFCFCD